MREQSFKKLNGNILWYEKSNCKIGWDSVSANLIPDY